MMRLKREVAACVAAARKDGGYTGDDRAYELTVRDCESIVEALGFRPTRQEWKAVGYAHVGDAHVGRVARYTLTVYCDIGVEEVEANDEDIDSYLSAVARRRLEKAVISVLDAKLDGNFDCEVVDVQIVTD
jgi:hypothetical protein